MAHPTGRDDTHPVRLTAGLEGTVLPDDSADLATALAVAQQAEPEHRRDAVAAVVRSHPRAPSAWAALGDCARDDVEAYAAYRVGYHRGLDALRANGWRGSGFVSGAHPANAAFLRCLDGLRRSAATIGEDDEVQRCSTFLAQLDPGWTGGAEG